MYKAALRRLVLVLHQDRGPQHHLTCDSIKVLCDHAAVQILAKIHCYSRHSCAACMRQLMSFCYKPSLLQTLTHQQGCRPRSRTACAAALCPAQPTTLPAGWQPARACLFL